MREEEKYRKYIDMHIKEKLTITKLGAVFHCSVSTIKRNFYLAYNVPIGEYIHKMKLIKCAEELQQESNVVKNIALEYGYQSSATFSRAFSGEFGITPSEYRDKNKWKLLLLSNKGYDRNLLEITYKKIEEIRLMGYAVKPVRGNDTDLLEEITYSQEHEFPRLEESVYRKVAKDENDEIAMWYHAKEDKEIKFLQGPVVNDFSFIPEGVVAETIKAGNYVIFRTKTASSKEELIALIRNLDSYVFKEWKKEYEAEENIEWLRFTFMRFRDNQFYLYLPIYELPEGR